MTDLRSAFLRARSHLGLCGCSRPGNACFSTYAIALEILKDFRRALPAAISPTRALQAVRADDDLQQAACKRIAVSARALLLRGYGIARYQSEGHLCAGSAIIALGMPAGRPGIRRRPSSVGVCMATGFAHLHGIRSTVFDPARAEGLPRACAVGLKAQCPPSTASPGWKLLTSRI